MQKYVDGVNTFIETRPQNIHLEFKLAGIKPSPWRIADSLTIFYYLGWASAANIESEIIAQMLVEKLGAAKAQEIFPLNINPARGWLGTCNHLTVSRDYPYHYTTHASPSYRYRRLSELMDSPAPKTVEDHWGFQRDTLNLMAKQIAPIMAQALLANEDTKTMGQIISEWDFSDHPDKTAPAVFQTVYREFALLVYADDLGEELAIKMLNNWYLWQKRLQKMVLEGKSSWFDNINTSDRKETRDDLFHQTAINAAGYLRSVLGDDPSNW